MKRIFLDTNFVIDYLARPEYLESCKVVLQMIDSRGIKAYISYLTVANFAYILRKQPHENKYALLNYCITLFNVIKGDAEQLKEAVSLKAQDFEDALQYQAAKSANCDCIITRNGKDFPFAEIPVLSPNEFIAALK